MPTPEEIRAAHPDIFGPAPDTTLPGQADDSASAPAPMPPGIVDRLKQLAGIATSPGMLAGVGQYGADALATASGNPELIPVAGAAGSAFGGAMGRAIHGEDVTPGNIGVDAALGAVAPYVGPAAKYVAGKVSAVRDSIPLMGRLMAYGMGGVASHGSPAVLGTEAALEAGPKLLDKFGDAANWVGKKLMAPFEPEVGEAAHPPIDTSKPPTKFRRATSGDAEVPYRMGGSTQTGGFNPLRARPGISDASALPESVKAIDSAIPKYPPLQSGDPAGSVNDMMTNQRGIDFTNKEFEANQPIVDRLAIEGNFDRMPEMKGAALERRAAFNTQTPEVVDPHAGPSSAGQVEPDIASVNDLLASMKGGEPVANHTPARDVTPPYETPDVSKPDVINKGKSPNHSDQLTADTEAQAARFRAANQHGVAGFSKFPAESVPSVRSLTDLQDYLSSRMRTR